MAVHRTPKRDERMLTPKEAVFVSHYLKNDTVKDAAAKAGLSPSGLLKRPAIARELKKRMGRVMAKNEITADRVIKELGKIAFANIDDFVDDEYRVQSKPSRKRMAAVQEVTTEVILAPLDKEGDPIAGKEDVKRVKMKMYSKLDALDKLGRHFKLFTDKVEISGNLAERLDRAYDKLAEQGAEPKDG